MTEHVTEQRDGNIATITLDRAEAGNALTQGMLSRLEEIGREIAACDDIRAVVIRAAGDNFSYGMDIKGMGGGGERSLLARRHEAELGGRMMRSLQNIPQPVVCAVQGVATGGAACIATAADFRVASSDARLGYGEVKLGINLMWNALPVCVHLVGPARAKQLIMSGRFVDAATLLQWGLLDEVCERGELDARAAAWAAEYAALPPLAVRMIKRSVNRVSGALDEAVMHADADQWMLAAGSEDFREAIAAFLDKREADFKGN